MMFFPLKIEILKRARPLFNGVWKRHFLALGLGRKIRYAVRGQALVEYLLMTLMLLALFTGLYRLLQGQVKILFAKAGMAILTAYY